ncbi:ParB N-terminal domain-containing protein [Micromonospora sp. WMMC273]|uniref:ParB N-terminal domain-containing protein n=1 Tax=Micromonospora sp. WMMC273 TaxID=3015157 RepID=UPI0022B703B0|nr:ParB N-terminal domain-containing protein [Micromonospora sp. WMMC273]MCZ7478813.1 ParB N-terminal domain-containing protein [Micromonospora sp. WMMC273]MCZ7478941.1 ParB N-terminal domain-containing protein [Micromonospora sp. WMMC273]
MVKGNKGASTQAGALIRAELAALAVPIDQVSNWPGNPRRGDIAKIKTSLTQHGQYTPLLVQASTGHVVKGNNTLIAMRELGATSVAVNKLDLTDDQARKILLLDNKTSDDAEYDEGELAALLASFGEATDDLADTGWSTAELDELLRASDHLGNQAAAFLDPMIAQAPDPATAAAAMATTAPPAAVPAAPAGPPADPSTAAAATEPAEVVLPPAPAAPAPPGEPQAPPVQYVQLSWTATAEQREVVREAVKLAQTITGSPIAVDALVAIARHYLTTAQAPAGADA